MTAHDAALLRRLAQRADSLTPDLRRAYLAGLEELRAALSVAEIARAIDTGSVERLLSEHLSDAQVRAAFAGLHTAILASVKTATEAAIRDLPRLVAKNAPGIAFDYLNPRVLDALRTLDTRVMTTLGDTIRETVRTRVQAGLEAGTNPRTIAQGLRSTLGLSARNAEAVARFRAELEAGDTAALRRSLVRGWMNLPERPVLKDGTLGSPRIPNRGHAGGKGLTSDDFAILQKKLGTDVALTPTQIDRMVKAYQGKLQAWEAETTARTAALDSQRLGQRLSWQDAADKMGIGTDRMVKTWHGVMDDRERPEHLAMEGETVPFDSPYSNGEMTPGDSTYNCRCQESVRLLPEADILAA